ncbi:MAG: hypothetical protein GX155_00805 [Smithella sp.]|nr:hypothetical protein [Smithella sp.]
MSRKLISSASTPVASHDTINYSVSTMSYGPFAHYVLDTGLRRYGDGDGFFTVTTQSPAEETKCCASRI